jgi:hypothetical protein
MDKHAEMFRLMAGTGVIHHFVREEDPVQRIHAEGEQRGSFVRSDQSLSRSQDKTQTTRRLVTSDFRG